MKTLTHFTFKLKLNPIIQFQQICSFPGPDAVSFRCNKDLFHSFGKSSNLRSSRSEYISDGHKRLALLFKHTFVFYNLLSKGRIRRFLLGLFLIFNSTFGLFCIAIAPEERIIPYAKLNTFGSGEISFVIDSDKIQKPSAYRVPFILRRNLILIEAMVEGKKGLLLLDTGMDQVVLNQNHFKGDSGGDNIIGVMGDMGYPQRKFVSMTIGDLPVHVKYALIADLDHLEQIFHVEILGICGVEYLQDFQWVIHYHQRFIDFYPLSKSGDVLDHSLSPPNEVLMLKNEAHLLIVKVQSKGYLMNLALDTGSSSTILDKDNRSSLEAHHAKLEQLEHTSKVTDINGKRKLVTSFALSELRVGSTVLPPLQISFVSLSRISKIGINNLDGMFNPIFLCHSIIGINWKKKRLYVWEYIPESQESVAGDLDQ